MNGNDIRFLGFKNQSELPALYDLCDVFVLPSTFEPWGSVVNEVMNAAKPVIVSDRVGAAPDLVGEGVNGYIYPHGDVSSLASKLKTVLELPQKERDCMDRRALSGSAISVLRPTTAPCLRRCRLSANVAAAKTKSWRERRNCNQLQRRSPGIPIGRGSARAWCAGWFLLLAI